MKAPTSSLPHSGIFISFEGTEGAGKSTLILALAERLIDEGFQVVTTREPGGSAVAEKIRALILGEPMDAWTEAFLYEAARAEHLAKTVVPALRSSTKQDPVIVLCDRFTDSTLAYQGMARGLDWKTLKKLNAIATAGLKPRLTVFVDIDPAQGLKDAKDPNRFEAEGTAFQTKVRKGFLKTIREEPGRFLKVQARSGSPEQMAHELHGRIVKKIPSLKKNVKKSSPRPSRLKK
ncbi:MAG: dTMP kinase [Cryobacterium sp.]|nr:dTMP kinase [Oligoflexia bacterium]